MLIFKYSPLLFENWLCSSCKESALSKICFAAVNSLHNVRICFLEKWTYDFDLTCTMNSDILSLCERSAWTEWDLQNTETCCFESLKFLLNVYRLPCFLFFFSALNRSLKCFRYSLYCSFKWYSWQTICYKIYVTFFLWHAVCRITAY